MKRRLGVCAIALSLLGCSAQASVSAKVGSGQGGAQTAGAESLKPRESNWDKEAREEAEIAGRGAPSHETGAAEATPEGAAAESAVPSPAGKSRRGKKHSRAKTKKHQDRGTEIAANDGQSDHDRGHGNDMDGVDEDNPGKRKKK